MFAHSPSAMVWTHCTIGIAVCWETCRPAKTKKMNTNNNDDDDDDDDDNDNTYREGNRLSC